MRLPPLRHRWWQRGARFKCVCGRKNDNSNRNTDRVSIRTETRLHEPDRTDTRRPTGPLDVDTARCALA